MQFSSHWLFASSSGDQCNKKPTNWFGQVERRVTQIWPKAESAALSAVFFSNFHKCRPEIAGDLIYGVAVDKVGMMSMYIGWF